MPLPLENKLALVTGASGSIGSAVAKRLAQDGASILVHYSSGREGAAAVVAEVFERPADFMKREIEVASVDMTMPEIAAAFSHVLGKPVNY